MNHEEKDRLERISNVSLYAAGVNPETIRYSFKIANRYLVGDSLLELGPAEGVMTELLATTGKRLTIVEGSKLFCEDLRRRFPQTKVVHALFEDYQPEEQFDNIILGHVLEHVQDPVDILRRARHWLKPKTGRLFAFSCAAGGILGRADARRREALALYARDLGVAFQIADDLLDALEYVRLPHHQRSGGGGAGCGGTGGVCQGNGGAA